MLKNQTSMQEPTHSSLAPEADATSWPRGRFNPKPEHRLPEGVLRQGYTSLADAVADGMTRGLRVLAVDGYHGVDFEAFRAGLAQALAARGVEAGWHAMEGCLKQADTLREELTPFLGGDDPIFGHIWPLGIEPYFQPKALAELRVKTAMARGRQQGSLTVVYGTGAALLDTVDEVWYADISKERIQQLQRAGKLNNWGDDQKLPFGAFYKRAYYIEWPALNRHKQHVLPRIGRMLDLHGSHNPVHMAGDDFRSGLDALTRTPFRPRPWFAPGPWGGQFMKGHMGLNPDEPNYAWSFELIAPENSVAFGDGENSLEVTFDWLLFNDSAGVMGTEAARQFGTEWPVRFDYLDTMQGGNLSVQVHPRPDYIREHFGETITQDETYYIALASSEAKVYLGFRDETDPEAFQALLETSARDGVEVDIDRYVHHRPSKTHDLFFIPNGTIHCSGRGNLVLEISATPYIYTFKLYDYLRRDLNGKLRPINLERGFANLYWDRRSEWVEEHLVAKPRILAEGQGWKELVLMDVPYTFYCIHRVDFERECGWDTDGVGYMVNLVEGDAVEVVTEDGVSVPLAYLESMVIPAATGKVRFVNQGQGTCRLMKVFVRPGTGSNQPLNNPL